MTIPSDAILLERRDSVAIVTFNRPASLNAFDRAMRRALREALAACDDPAVRAIVLTGSGRAFSVGQDVQELAGADASYSLARLIEDEWAPLVAAIREHPKPVIAAVNGAAAGGGLTIALAADIRVAEPGTQFLPAFVQVGLVPDSGAAHLLVHHLGLSRALSLALTGGRLSAEDARAAGLVWEVAENADELLPLAERWAVRVAALPPLAVSATKEVLRVAADASFSGTVALETAHQARLGQTQDYREAVRAFIDKRRPQFTGQ